jgi:hypothetical protein
MERHLGPDPDPVPAWFVHYAQGTAWTRDDPDRGMQYLERGTAIATDEGLPYLANITDLHAMALHVGHLPPHLAAPTAGKVLAGLWEARDVVNLRVAVAHIIVVCTTAGWFREAAVIDGWLGSDAIPLAPHYVARLAAARRDIDAHLGDEAAALRSQGAASLPATIVEHMLTTLTSIAEGGDADQTIRVSLPVQ